MKKILVIAPYPYLPFFSGGQKLIAKFLEYLGKETDVTVLSTEGNDWSLAKGYSGLSLFRKSFSRYFDIRSEKKIIRIIQQEKPGLLICEHPYMAWLAFRVRRKTGIPVIIHTHNIEYQRFRTMGKWWWTVLKYYEKRIFKKADGLLFITPEDREFALQKWKIPANKCFDVPFGIDINHFPEDREENRRIVNALHNIDAGDKILSFNGLLNYKPNLDALKIILDEINPRLQQQKNYKYKIIISGKHLPGEMEELKAFSDKNIIFTGFTDNIELYLKASDIFLNPVLSGGGVKTKIVEAIGYGVKVVSTKTGARGIYSKACKNKLAVTEDADWDGFTAAILKENGGETKTTSEYYQYYNWHHIIRNLLTFLSGITGKSN